VQIVKQRAIFRHHRRTCSRSVVGKKKISIARLVSEEMQKDSKNARKVVINRHVKRNFVCVLAIWAWGFVQGGGSA
jgi:hypothetical protein